MEFNENDTKLEEFNIDAGELHIFMESFRQSLMASVWNFAIELTNEILNSNSLEQLEEIDDFVDSIVDFDFPSKETENDPRKND